MQTDRILDENGRKFIVHVGFAKTGSTSLQNALSKSKKINYFGFPFRSRSLNHFLRLELCNANELIYNEKAVKKICQSEAEIQKEGPVVISSEEF
jgi:hypothetical protein